ncbi:unnamed protein product [Blepharisma stoltei]|uniref:Uncharacterized protein n=1 Tax=Blepharisma stoltei TaxID=1481888 RepID=A0AAU9IK11_9CILI|nr:unnamed protein product [Blepharisma stoltei]
MKSLISIIAILWLAASDPTMISKDGYLDPGRITWWQDSWAPNPIELSQTNAGTSNAFITVNFRPFTSINSDGNLGIVQVTVPSNFVGSSSATTYTSSLMEIKGSTDYSFSFKVSSLPSPGVYGPLQIVTRSIATGQLYDANYVFGCIAVGPWASSPASNSLQAAAATLTPTTGYVGSKDSIIFTFSIPAGVNLWKHDIFEIIPDTYWSISTDTSISCSSIDVSANSTNYIKGPQGDNNLPCAIALSGGAGGGLKPSQSTNGETNSVYIYGLSQDVIVTSAYEVQLKVVNFIFPGSARPLTSYTWKLKIWRWGTTTLLAQFMGNGPLTPAIGSIKVTSWAPYNSKVSSTDIPSSNTFSIFTKLTLQISHAITIGSIAITFNNADISTAKWYQDHANPSSGTSGLCYLNNYAQGVSCKVSNSIATITFDSTSAGLGAEKSISITLLAKLSANAQISSIVSSDSAAKIDKLDSAFLWSFGTSSSYHAMGDFEFFATDSYKYKGSSGFTSGLQIGGYLATTQYLMWFMQPSTSWAANTKLTVNLPLSVSGVQLAQTYINIAAQYYDGAFSDSAADTALNILSSTGNSPKLSDDAPGSITITFASGKFPSANQYFAFAYGDPSSGSDSKTTALPFVQSNVATFYECWAQVTPSGSSSATEFYNYVYSVYTLQTDPSLTVAPLCTDKFVGIPIAVTYHALNMAFSFGEKINLYYLDVTFSDGTNLGTGLSDGSSLPVISTKSGVTPVASITSNTVTISGLGSVTSGNTLTILLPNGASGSSLSGTATFYYVIAGGDPNIKMFLYSKSSTNNYNTDTANGISSSAISTPQNGAYTVGAASTTSSGNFQPSSSGTISQSDWIGVGLPSGFAISTSSASLAFGGTSSKATYSVSLSSSSFIGGFILGEISNRISLSSTSTTSISIGGLTAPMSTGQTADAASNNLVVFSALQTAGSPCTVIGNVGITVNAAKITLDSCVLDKPYTQGSDSVDSALLLSFTTVNPVPGNGKITITLASSTWTLPNSSPLVVTCEGKSFTDYSDTVKRACSISDTTVTLTGFAEILAGQISVNIYHVIPSSSATSLPCFTDVNTYDANGFLIDSAKTLTNSFSVSTSSDIGKTNTDGFIAKAYPNVAGAVSDIYLGFSFSKAIPQYSIIKISPGFVSTWYFSGDITNSCWTSKDTYSCSVSDSYVTLQLGRSLLVGEQIQVYLDSALTLPSSSSTSAGWTISTSWNGTPITADPNPSASFLFTVGSSVDSKISSLSIKQVDSSSAGESTSYTFTFSSSSNVTAADYFVIKFPREFDPHIGDAKLSLADCFSSNWYLTCSSTTLGIDSGSFCSVDHWKLTISGVTKVVTDTTSVIDITVNMVQNPTAGTLSEKFSLYHYGSDGSVKAYIQNTGSLTIGSVVGNIVSLKDVTVNTADLSSSATYTFDFYAAATYTTDYIISIIFPQQFNIKLRNISTISCESNYFDESSLSTSTTNRAFSTAKSCNINGNTISHAFQSESSLELASTSRIQIHLTSLYNPEWGYTRSSGWDVTDYATFSNHLPDVWSNKFDIAVYDSSTPKTFAKSYGVLNSAYVGYTLSTTDISTGTYEPNRASGGIKLLPGQQSKDITISVLDNKKWPMRSKSLKLKPITNVNYPDNGNIKYTSATHNFTAYQMTSTINFRVSATISAATGIYYIDWGKPVETLQEGVSNNIYSAPVSMLIEVCSTLAALTISIDQLPTFYHSYISLPIKVTPSYPPATQLIVTPSFSLAGMTISPTSLTFGPDVDELYFQVYVDSSFSSKENSLSFKLSGTDALAYATPIKMTASISSALPTVVTTTPTISGTSINGSEYKLSIGTTLPGILYWGLGCQGKPILDYEDLVSSISDLVHPSSTTQTLQEQLADEYQHINTAENDTDIYSFFRRIHASHCDSYWASSQVISTLGTTLDFNWLMGGTSYTFIAYISTRMTNNTAAYPLQTYNFTTNSIGQLYTTSVTFNGTVLSSSSENIKKVLAKNMGINPSWLVYKASARRRLAETVTTTFTYSVLSDSRYPSFTSQMIIENLNKAQSISDFSSSSLEVLNIGQPNAISAGETPLWNTSPVIDSITDKAVKFVAATSVAGKIYTSCSNNDITGHTTYAWQIVDGLDATSTKVKAGSAVSTTSSITSIQVSELDAETFYICYFTACNDYPLAPSCIDSNLPRYSIRTPKATGSSSSAQMMGISATLALALVFLS